MSEKIALQEVSLHCAPLPNLDGQGNCNFVASEHDAVRLFGLDVSADSATTYLHHRDPVGGEATVNTAPLDLYTGSYYQYGTSETQTANAMLCLDNNVEADRGASITRFNHAFDRPKAATQIDKKRSEDGLENLDDSASVFTICPDPGHRVQDQSTTRSRQKCHTFSSRCSRRKQNTQTLPESTTHGSPRFYTRMRSKLSRGRTWPKSLQPSTFSSDNLERSPGSLGEQISNPMIIGSSLDLSSSIQLNSWPGCYSSQRSDPYPSGHRSLVRKEITLERWPAWAKDIRGEPAGTKVNVEEEELVSAFSSDSTADEDKPSWIRRGKWKGRGKKPKLPAEWFRG